VDINVQGLLNVLEEAAAAGVRKLVLRQLRRGLRRQPGRAENRDMLPEPKSPYAITKLDGEFYLEMFRREGALETASLRFFNVFGPRQDPARRLRRGRADFHRKGLAGEPLAIFGDGGQTRDFIYVKDIVGALAFAAPRAAQGADRLGQIHGSVPGACCWTRGSPGTILVIEPRRMAARLLAGWVAKQRAATLGREVGYAVRFDSKYRKDTRIIYLTDGVFQRWIQDDPELRAWARWCSTNSTSAGWRWTSRWRAASTSGRPAPGPAGGGDVRHAGNRRPGGLLAPAAALEAGGRTFPVEVLYRPDRPPVNDRRGGPPREIPVWEKMVAVCREAMAMPDAGNILMFLPGTHEIRRTIELLENGSASRGWDVFPALQRAAARRAGSGDPPGTAAEDHRRHQRRGNLAHHRGRAHRDRLRPRPHRRLRTAPRHQHAAHPQISRAAAEQRAGRAGRTAPGRCLPLVERGGSRAPRRNSRRRKSTAWIWRRPCCCSRPRAFPKSGVPLVRRAHRSRAGPRRTPAARPRRARCRRNLTDEGAKMAALPLEPRFPG
jgi:ATP-dependent helicase HrpB